MNELELVGRLRVMKGVSGIGDDCAVFRPKAAEDLLLKTDQLIEGVHFPKTMRAETIGERALARALSDIAAAGGDAWVLRRVICNCNSSTRNESSSIRFLAETARTMSQMPTTMGTPTTRRTIKTHGSINSSFRWAELFSQSSLESRSAGKASRNPDDGSDSFSCAHNNQFDGLAVN